MSDALVMFERIVRSAGEFTEERAKPAGGFHPFDERNIHPTISDVVKKLFDDGHFAQATFEAFKFVDKEIQRHSGNSEIGFKLMMKVFSEDAPLIKLNTLQSTSEKDEQKGYQFLFAGSMLAIRNPRGHEIRMKDTPDECLDHLSLASLLLRRLEISGYICR